MAEVLDFAPTLRISTSRKSLVFPMVAPLAPWQRRAYNQERGAVGSSVRRPRMKGRTHAYRSGAPLHLESLVPILGTVGHLSPVLPGFAAERRGPRSPRPEDARRLPPVHHDARRGRGPLQERLAFPENDLRGDVEVHRGTDRPHLRGVPARGGGVLDLHGRPVSTPARP